LPGKENYVSDALSRTKIEETMFTDNFEENIPEETASNADATAQCSRGQPKLYFYNSETI